jgi:hypothetical protein
MDYDNAQIALIIYREFGIYKTIDEIEKLKFQLTPKSLKSVEVQNSKEIVEDAVIVTRIKHFLSMENYTPRTAKEITQYINREFHLSLKNDFVNRLLHDKNLNNEIKYCRDDYTYSIIYNKESLISNNLKINGITPSKNNNWSIKIDPNFSDFFKIEYDKKMMIMSSKKLTYERFIHELFELRNTCRSPELDLFFENFEFFLNLKLKNE